MGQAADPLSIWVKELVEVAGGRFLGTPGKTTDAESIAASDPDVVVMAWCGAGDRVPLERTVEKRGLGPSEGCAQWPCLLYFRRIVEYACSYAVEGLKALASVIHPKIFDQPQRPGVKMHRLSGRTI